MSHNQSGGKALQAHAPGRQQNGQWQWLSDCRMDAQKHGDVSNGRLGRDLDCATQRAAELPKEH
jgi:hypothetical protein